MDEKQKFAVMTALLGFNMTIVLYEVVLYVVLGYSVHSESFWLQQGLGVLISGVVAGAIYGVGLAKG